MDMDSHENMEYDFIIDDMPVTRSNSFDMPQSDIVEEINIEP